MADEDMQGREGSKKEEPIIVKKVKKGGHAAHHGGAWKVAYADFVTAMMAFFIVMWILASSEEVKQSVSAYFEDPAAFNVFTGKREVPIDLGMKPSSKKGDGEFDKEPMVIAFNDEMRDSVVSKLQQRALLDSVNAREKIEEMGKELKKEFEDMILTKPNLKKILESIRMEMTKEGLKVELIETEENLFFQIGSAKLTQDAIDILSLLAKEFGKLPNYIEIQGHTDSRSYSKQSVYTNWELSSDRANAARRVLSYNGLWEGQVSKVTGFADQQLHNPNNPFDRTNRRVSIIVRNMSAYNFLPKEGQEGGSENAEE